MTSPIQPCATFRNIPLDVLEHHMAPHMAPSDIHALRHTRKAYSQFGTIAPQGDISVDQLKMLIGQTPYIVSVDFSKCAASITDKHLELLEPYAHQIKELNLAHCTQVTDKGFKIFKDSPLVALNLSHLSLSNIFLNTAHFEIFARERVRSDVGVDTADSVMLPFTLNVAKLERLDLSSCDIKVFWQASQPPRLTLFRCSPTLLFKNCHLKHLNVTGAHSGGRASISSTFVLHLLGKSDFLEAYYKDSYDWTRKAISIIDAVPVYINNALCSRPSQQNIIARLAITLLVAPNHYLMSSCLLVAAAITTLAAAIFVVAAGISSSFSSKHSAHLLASAKLAFHDAISHLALSIVSMSLPFAVCCTPSLLGVSTHPEEGINVQDIRSYLFNQVITKF